MLRKTEKNASRTLISLAVFFFVLAVAMVGYAIAEEATDVPEGQVPFVEAEEIEKEEAPVFREGIDEPALRPNHPPIDEIPPMPMPYPPEEWDEQPASTEPGAGVYHNAVTGETIVLPVDETALSGEFGQGGGYSGADGGDGAEMWPATFNDMYQINNTGSSPWRMNAKLVMRFEDAMGTDRFACCSGTMRDAEAVLTAGHCVYDHSHDWGWAKEIWVYPGWDGVGGQFNPPPSIINPYGYGRGTYFASLKGWTNNGNFDYDLGVIEITRGVGMLTGWYSWAYGGSCDWHKSQTYNNASYPAEDCPDAGLHNGSDMYYWHGHFDACPNNQLQLNTGDGHCFDTVWGGMSGSGAYYKDGDSRYVHAVCSTSNRWDRGYYCRQLESWVNYLNDTFVPVYCRGSSFDIQAMDVNAEPATIQAGNSTTLLNHLATNPTNGSANDNWTFRVYLSTNDNISSADTLLSTQNYNWDSGTMSSVRVNMVQVTIPENTPEGDYWLGLVYDSATDGNSSNNDTDGWDAVQISVTPETDPPTPNPMTWSTEPYETNTSSISMVATTASDLTPPITYHFDFYSSPTGGSGGNDSSWQSSTSFTDSGLGTNHQYGYRVRAKDGNDNQSSYSSVSYDYTDIETPSGITFGAITTNSIQAKSINTPSGLTRGSSGLRIYNITKGTDSGWTQNNNYWTSGSLSVNTLYGFRAKARNGDADETGYCSTSYHYTLANAPGTSSFSNVTQTSIRANWTANGNPSGTEYYCENTTAGANSGWTTNTYYNSAGLTCGTSYTFRVKARNGNGTQTGWTNLGSQSTQPCLTTPTVTTTGVSSITSNSAFSGGNVINDGGAAITARGVCWSRSANPTTSDSHTSDGTGTGSFTSSITGLSPNTTYHVRAYATNSEGTGYGSNQTFTTSASAPDTTPPTPNPMTWATQPYPAGSTSISMVATTATDSESPPVSYFFDFVSSPTGGSGGSDSGWQSSMSYTDTGLQPNHQYGYRVKARDSASTPNETNYSSTVYKYTHANAPGTSSFSNITQTSIQANWTANGNPAGTQYYCENTTAGANSGWTTNAYWNSAGLTCGTSYTFRMKAKNGDGTQTGWTNLGSQSTQTGPSPPTVTTTAISSITENSASSGGNVTSDGGASVAARGVCWSTSANPTTSDSHTSDGIGTGSFTSSITGLSPKTTYHVRAYATNSEGTAYGSEKTFTTGEWETAYDTLFRHPSDLTVLRQYRDEFLIKTTKGKLYTRLLYNRSEKALQVLLQNPELMMEAKHLIEANKGAVSEVLHGYEGVIYNTDEIVSFLKAYARKSPPGLKLLAITVEKEMLRQQRQGEKFLGFWLE